MVYSGVSQGRTVTQRHGCCPLNPADVYPVTWVGGGSAKTTDIRRGEGKEEMCSHYSFPYQEHTGDEKSHRSEISQRINEPGLTHFDWIKSNKDQLSGQLSMDDL